MAETLDVQSLWRFPLIRRASDHPRDGACLLAAASWIEYGALDTDPPDTSFILAFVGRDLNSIFSSTPRQRLKGFIPYLVRSYDKEAEPARRYHLLVKTTMHLDIPVSLLCNPMHFDASGVWSRTTRIAYRAASLCEKKLMQGWLLETYAEMIVMGRHGEPDLQKMRLAEERFEAEAAGRVEMEELA
jgi:hypothetical protein